jgi:mono/diheme cytochrome c family protein
MPVDRDLLERGRQRYDVFCSPCHGLAGFGDGMVARRADELQEGTWTPPTSFHSDLIRQRPDGHLYNTITNGIRNMPGYGSQIPVEDRWAVVAYVRALQRSQNATVDDVPPAIRAQLR